MTAEVSSREKGWCRDERLRTGQDVLVASRDGYTLVRCVGEFGPHNIHAGKWIVWGPTGHCLSIGSEEWARRSFSRSVGPCRVCGGSGFIAVKQAIDDGFGEVDSCSACEER